MTDEPTFVTLAFKDKTQTFPATVMIELFGASRTFMYLVQGHPDMGGVRDREQWNTSIFGEYYLSTFCALLRIQRKQDDCLDLSEWDLRAIVNMANVFGFNYVGDIMKRKKKAARKARKTERRKKIRSASKPDDDIYHYWQWIVNDDDFLCSPGWEKVTPIEGGDSYFRRPRHIDAE